VGYHRKRMKKANAHPSSIPSPPASHGFVSNVSTRDDRSLKGRLAIKPVANPSGIPMSPPIKPETRIVRTSPLSVEVTAKNVANVPMNQPMTGPSKPPTNKPMRISLYRGALADIVSVLLNRSKRSRTLCLRGSLTQLNKGAGSWRVR